MKETQRRFKMAGKGVTTICGRPGTATLSTTQHGTLKIVQLSLGTRAAGHL